ncbi:MAG TPA: hypothetical protein VFU19_13470 [Iamia sp.]|nr:hypothetical protein [Iamia sp.]
MPDLVDPSDLIDTTEVATLIGVAPGSVSVYRKRVQYEFPAPVIEKGRCLLWLRSDVEAWARSTGRA